MQLLHGRPTKFTKREFATPNKYRLPNKERRHRARMRHTKDNKGTNWGTDGRNRRVGYSGSVRAAVSAAPTIDLNLLRAAPKFGRKPL